MKFLFEKGVDVNAQGRSFSSVVQAASSRGHEQIVELLRSEGASWSPEQYCLVVISRSDYLPSERGNSCSFALCNIVKSQMVWKNFLGCQTKKKEKKNGREWGRNSLKHPSRLTHGNLVFAATALFCRYTNNSWQNGTAALCSKKWGKLRFICLAVSQVSEPRIALSLYSAMQPPHLTLSPRSPQVRLNWPVLRLCYHSRSHT